MAYCEDLKSCLHARTIRNLAWCIEARATIQFKGPGEPVTVSIGSEYIATATSWQEAVERLQRQAW